MTDPIAVTQADEDRATVLVEQNIDEWGWGPLTEIEGLAEFNLAVKAASLAIADTRHRLAQAPDTSVEDGEVGELIERLRSWANDDFCTCELLTEAADRLASLSRLAAERCGQPIEIDLTNHHNAAKCPHCTGNGRFVMIEAAEHQALQERCGELAEAQGEIARLRTERDELRTYVLAFGAPAAAEYAKAHGFPKGGLHPVHYDILASCGARMDDFTRAALNTGGEAGK